MAKAGVRPKQNVPRYPSGQIVHSFREPKAEKPEKIMAVVLAQPHRRGNGSQFAGYAFGRLFLGGQIDSRQHRAAEIYMTRTIRHMKHITGSLPNFTSPLANMVKLDLEFQRDRDPAPADSRIADEIMRTEEERTADIRSAYGELQDALADAGMHFDGNSILTRICVSDRDPTNDVELGAFRCALNVIANRLRL